MGVAIAENIEDMITDLDVEDETIPKKQELPPAFSEISDTSKCNCHVIPKTTIDRIISSNFRACQQVQEDKM